MRPEKLSVDEARLLPRARERAEVIERIRLERAQASIVVDVAKSSSSGEYPLRWKAEPADLRGIPVVGRGVGGVSPGTSPTSAIGRVARDAERRARAA